MATKIDYRAIFNPLLKISKETELSAEKRLQMIVESMEETLDEKSGSE